jgi:hypothetical protein
MHGLAHGRLQGPSCMVDPIAAVREPVARPSWLNAAITILRHTLDPSVPRHRYGFFPLDYSVLYCAHHDKLTGNTSFQDNLLNILLSSDAR